MSGALFERLERPTDDVALRVGERALAFRELKGACEAHRARLLAAGVAPGAHVGVWTQPSLESAVALLANAWSGFVTVPLDPKLGPLELGHVAKDAKPVVTVAADVEAVKGRISDVPVHPFTLSPSKGAEPQPPARFSPSGVEGRRADHQPLLILYTSGTTGLPKGAILSAANVASNVDVLARAWEWTAEDTVVHALPLFHVHGLVLGLYGSMRVGGGLVWLPKFTPEGVAEALSQRRSMLFAVPTMYFRLADAAAANPTVAQGLRAARLLGCGSAGIPLRELLRIDALTGKRVHERYGLTETLINCAVRYAAPSPAGTVGAALEGVEVRLVDDARTPLDVFDDATIGEVAVRGPNVFLGYLNRPDATRAVLDEDGWFYTGDLACRRADGSIRIVGRRATDLIKCGGYKVGAGEVEAALLEHPEVAEAAVLGAPDDELGERIVAFVVARAPVEAKALEDFVAKQLSPHKRPRQVHLVAELPRNAMGKVQKTLLKKRLAPA